MGELQFNEVAKDYSCNHIDKILRPKAIERIVWHKEHGHKIVIVSASIDSWLKPWCDKNDLDLIATKLEIKNGILTGNFLTNNCYGNEKVIRVKQEYNLSNYEHIYAYGDSRGDRELLDLAHTKFYRKF